MVYLTILILLVGCTQFVLGFIILAIAKKEQAFSIIGANGSYRPLWHGRFILGLVLSTPWVWKQIFLALTKRAYLSTRIAPNKDKGWDKASNLNLARQRQKYVETTGTPVLNPNQGGQFLSWLWNGTGYLYFWFFILTLMRLRQKAFVYFTEDLAGSAGVNRELEFAQRYQMTILPFEDPP
ncbi:MAG TPA: hypothetical protein VJB37_00645 [Patescibacteria group bacterium]|nr:hypothetical protein [Patescibacteria group bacterium]